MRAAPMRTCLLILGLCVATGCSTPPYRGAWAHEDTNGYFGISFEDNGQCRVVQFAKHDAGRTGVAARCSYSVSGRALTITELWDSAGDKGPPPEPVIFELGSDNSTLVLTGPERATLFRVWDLSK